MSEATKEYGPDVIEEEKVLHALLTEAFDNYFHDKRGGASFDYITGEQCISRLNKAFGPLGWTFEIVRSEINEAADECVVYGRLSVFRVMRLSRNGEDYDHIQTVVREQIGSQKIGRSRSNTSMILDIGFNWKAAATDSLKKCATLLGIALDLYDKTPAYSEEDRGPRPMASGASNGAQRPRQGASAAPGGARTGGGGKSFTPPFRAIKKTYDDNQCAEASCDTVMVETETYEYTPEGGQPISQTGEYIIRRAKEEAFGKVLCMHHLMLWIQAKKDQGVPLKGGPKAVAAA